MKMCSSKKKSRLQNFFAFGLTIFFSFWLILAHRKAFGLDFNFQFSKNPQKAKDEVDVLSESQTNLIGVIKSRIDWPKKEKISSEDKRISG